MVINCGKCKHEFNLDDTRVPAAASFKVKCPKCTEVIVVKGSAATAPAHAPSPTPPPAPAPSVRPEEWERLKPFVEEYVNLRIEALKKELDFFRAYATPNSTAPDSAQMQLHKKALICESNAKIAPAV